MESVFLQGILDNIVMLSGTVGEYLKILAVFAVMDFGSGFIKAYTKGEISSRKMSNGVMRKLGILIAAAMVYEIDIILGTQGMLASMTKYWFIIMEAISILENLQQAGVVLPNFLLKGLNGCKETFELKGEEALDSVEDKKEKE